MKFKRSTFRLSFLAALAAGMSVPTVNAAQLEEIVVTAQKRSENLQDVPIALSAFTGETLQNLGVSQVDSLEQLTPGLSIRSIGAATIPYIRGVGADSFAVGNESPNALYLDGAYVSYAMSGTFFDFFDVERVEVLKGPQGTLFGRNATGGAINVHTRKPTADTVGQLEVGYGKYDTTSIKGYLSGAISESAGLFGSVAAVVNESEGYLTNISTLNGFSDEDVGGSETDAFRIKLLWEATDDLSFTLIGDSVEGQNRAALAWQPLGDQPSIPEALVALGVVPAIVSPSTREPHDFSQDVQPFGEIETSGLNLTALWSTDVAEVKYIGAYREFTGHTSGDGDASPLEIAAFYNYREIDTTTHEIQFTSVSDGPFSWIGGLFYFEDEAGYGGGDHPFIPDAKSLVSVGLPDLATPLEYATAIFAGAPVAILERDSTRLAESAAVYGEGTYEFNDQTSLTLGLRYTDEKATLSDRETSILLPNSTLTGMTRLNTFTGPDVSQSADELTYTVIVDHNFTDDILAYASYKTGFKSGIYDTGTPLKGTATDPEEIDAFEIGLKSTVLDGSMRLNAALFQYKYDNLQVNSLDPILNSVVTENAAEAEIFGAELNIDWAATDNFSVAFNLSLLDTEYVSYPRAEITIPDPVAGGFISSRGDLSGFSLPQAPEWSANIALNYIVPLNENGMLNLSTNMYFSDSVIYNQITNFETGSYEQINASATWTSPSDRYYVRLWGTNLTDAEVPACNAQIAFGNVCNYRPPVSYGITAGIRFGE